MLDEQPNDEKLIKEFPTCRVCGSKETAVAYVIKREKAADKISEKAAITPCIQKMDAVVSDPLKAPLIGSKVPIVVAVTDVCLGCGTLRATHVIEVDGNVGPMKGNMPLGGIPFTGRG